MRQSGQSDAEHVSLESGGQQRLMVQEAQGSPMLSSRSVMEANLDLDAPGRRDEVTGAALSRLDTLEARMNAMINAQNACREAIVNEAEAYLDTMGALGQGLQQEFACLRDTLANRPYGTAKDLFAGDQSATASTLASGQEPQPRGDLLPAGQTVPPSEIIMDGVREHLEVTIVSCTGLRNVDVGPAHSKSDLYCICKVGSKPGSKHTEFRTQVLHNDLNPAWNYTSKICDYNPLGDMLVFSVMDRDPTKNDDFLGQATLRIRQIEQSGGVFDGKLKLVDAGKLKGQEPMLHVQVKVICGQTVLSEVANNSQSMGVSKDSGGAGCVGLVPEASQDPDARSKQIKHTKGAPKTARKGGFNRPQEVLPTVKGGEDGMTSKFVDGDSAAIVTAIAPAQGETMTQTAVKHHSLIHVPVAEIMREACEKFERVEDELFHAHHVSAPRWVRVVKSPKFDIVVGIVIALNVVVMSMSLEYEGQMLRRRVFSDECAGEGGYSRCQERMEGMETFFLVIEQIFTVFFAAELACRLGAEGCAYLKSATNFLDMMIVLLCSVDSWVMTPSGIGGGGASNMAILRLLRLVRLMKVARVVRVMKAFKALRVLVKAVLASVGALMWSMTLLFILELAAAILLARLFRPYIEDITDQVSPETREYLWTNFGTCWRAFFSTFEITMAPGAFMRYRWLFDEIHPAFCLFFFIYTVAVTFAVVRVISAMFLKATLAADTKDNDEVSQLEGDEREKYVKLIQDLGDAADMHPMDKADFHDLLDSKPFDDWLENLGLQQYDTSRLFQVLDCGAGKVHYSDLVDILQQLRGPPRAFDVVCIHYQVTKMLAGLERIGFLRDPDISHPHPHHAHSGGTRYASEASTGAGRTGTTAGSAGGLSRGATCKTTPSAQSSRSKDGKDTHKDVDNNTIIAFTV